LEAINIAERLFINVSPNEAEVAIAPIDYMGNLGDLNKYVLSQYGYNTNDLPTSKQLEFAGFGTVTNENKKPIIFVVTIDGKRDTKAVLEGNLYKTLVEFRGWFENKKLWLPLMGTGTGGLTLQDSCDITIRVVNRFLKEYQTRFSLFISLPDTGDARILRNQLLHSVETNNTAKEFVHKLNARFYLAGAFWSGDDQVERFFEESIWEKGHEDESYSEIINNIKVNDIIILKSAFPSNSDSILRIKGIGVVIRSSSDGALVGIDWRIKNINKDIPGLGKYRRTIAIASTKDAIAIFSFLDRSLWQKLLPPPPNSPSVAENRIAGLISDSEKGNDYLGIDKDVRAFARVIAAKSFQPPLAIALFGKWGSGKSFFMRKLREQVEDFSQREANGMYCKGVVHIHFNAWSYMDANLWASFVSRIFEGLQEYIKNEKLSTDKLNNIKSVLTNKLNVTKTNIDTLKEKKGLIEKQIDLLNKKRDNAKKNVEEKISQLRKKTAWDILAEVDREFDSKKQIINEIEANPTYQNTKEELKEIVPEKYWDNPESAYEQAKSKYTFIKTFFRRKNLGWNLVWLGAILLIISVTPIILELAGIGISKLDFTISQAGIAFLITLGTMWKRAEIVYQKLQPVVASFWKIKENYEQRKEKALSRFEQEEKALKLEIEKGTEEVFLLTEQIQKAEIIATELEYKITNALASETLYSFIDERSKSDDYKKHLGIISIIRKDFEILNGLFIGHNDDIVGQSKAGKFREYFKKPVERIILYIDDLDRCPEENVVQVLEAVNLLMAFPLFIVVVGVDPRWVKNALIKKHALQFANVLNEQSFGSNGVEQIQPSNYLEKIFQVPFHLKDAKPQNVKDMIRELAATKPENETNVKDDILKDSAFLVDEDGAFLTDSDGTFLVSESSDTGIMEDEVKIKIHEDIDFIELSNKEIELLQEMGEIIGPNPRAIKRFVNIFKIVKAHEDYTVKDGNTQDDLLAILFLLSLSTGRFRCLMPSFETYIENPSNENRLMTFYLQNTADHTYLKEKHMLNVILSNNPNYHILQNLQAGIFNHHNDFIKRFTFKNL